jgi:hypothetical protein
MPTITRQRTRPGIRLVEATNLPGILLVLRPHDGGQVLAVVSADEPTQTLRGMARPILEAEHRRHLSRFLSDRKRKR